MWPRKIAFWKPHERPKTPQRPGYYWAKLVKPRSSPINENWAFENFEPVYVFDIGTGRLVVSSLGISPYHEIEAFEWGPRIEDFNGVYK